MDLSQDVILLLRLSETKSKEKKDDIENQKDSYGSNGSCPCCTSRVQLML